ncbi:hypothetical protein ACIGHG_23635 [Bacillus sp. NPDC077411]|uniref:hypothetical protein n=1 Tax=Bacillus sp. NPDC077411 TaxID=3363947 RepID=UPI0037CC980B
MYPFIVYYEIPPMSGIMNVEINAKDEDEALYLVRNFLTRGAVVQGAARKFK